MAVVARLLTLVNIADEDGDSPDARRMSVSARHEAVLADGRRVVLLDDRGWSEELRVGRVDEPSEDLRRPAEPPDVWAFQTVEAVTQTARDVVGPDEPFDDHTQADMEASHWDYLVRILRGRGIEVEPADLRGLPHDVELSDGLHARIGRDRPHG